MLQLTANKLSRLPPALAAATGLTRLCLLDNGDLALSEADVEGILLRMPRLATLHLGAKRTPAPVLCRLFRAAPQLEITDERASLSPPHCPASLLLVRLISVPFQVACGRSVA